MNYVNSPQWVLQACAERFCSCVCSVTVSIRRQHLCLLYVPRLKESVPAFNSFHKSDRKISFIISGTSKYTGKVNIMTVFVRATWYAVYIFMQSSVSEHLCLSCYSAFDFLWSSFLKTKIRRLIINVRRSSCRQIFPILKKLGCS